VPPRGRGPGARRQGVTCGRLPPAADTLRRTPLFDRHEQAGARLVPFAGWEMPVQYEGIRQEHVAVRTGAGMFDVSHMGEIETSGPQAEDLLQRLLSNDVTKIAERGAQYSVLCREDGGVLDDLFTYRLGPDHFLTVTNASNHEKDLAWFREHAGDFDAEVTDAHERWAMLAVQGPNARAAVERVGDGELPERMRTADVSIAGVECLACGTGYTGEDGVELLIPPDGAAAVWDALLEQGVVPAPATRCGSRSASTSTATTCLRTATRSRPASGGAASSTRASSEQTHCAGSVRSRRSCRSPSRAPASRGRATPCAPRRARES
jgi:glycine cleavage system T protein